MKSTGSFLTRPSLGLNTIPWMRGYTSSSRRTNCVVETSDPLSDSWAMICPVSAALTTPVQRRYGNEEYYRPTLHCVPFSYSSFTSFSFTSILLRCTGPVEQHITIRRVISSHPVDLLTYRAPILYRLRHCSITFSSTSWKWRSSSSCGVS